MAVTQLTNRQLGAKSVTNAQEDITTTGVAVVSKITAGNNITLSSTGIDAGTGNVTVNNTYTTDFSTLFALFGA